MDETPVEECELKEKDRGVLGTLYSGFLVPAVLLITVPTIDGSALSWLEGDFCLLTTVRTDNFVHRPRTAIRTTTHSA